MEKHRGRSPLVFHHLQLRTMAKQKVNILIPMAGEGSRFLQAG